MYVRATAIRWVSGEPQPGIVDVEIKDVDGRAWRFRDKSAIFDADGILTAAADYPVTIRIPCEVLSQRRDLQDRDMFMIRLPDWMDPTGAIEVYQDQLLG